MRVAIAFLGYGELARSWCSSLSASEALDLRAFVRGSRGLPPDLGPDRASSTGRVRLSASPRETLRGADVVISAVPSAAIVDLARQCAPFLEPGAVYVDVASAAPSRKQEAAALVAESGAGYVDAAVMGAVTRSGLQVPILAAGPGATRWSLLFSPYGADIKVLPGPVGDAARLKLLRSVYMKGRDALIVEMTDAARRYGLEKEVVDSIPHQSGGETFGALVERVLDALGRHGARRADELLAAREVVSEVGVAPIMTDAAEQRLREFERSGPDATRTRR